MREHLKQLLLSGGARNYVRLAAAVLLLAIAIFAWGRFSRWKKAQQGRPISDEAGLLYISVWKYRYRCRKFLSSYASWAVLGLSIIEVFGPLTHLLPEQALEIRVAIAALLFLAAGVTIWHHRRMERMLERYEALVGSLMVILEGPSASTASSREDTVKNILDSIILALQHKHKSCLLSATVLGKDSGPFTVFAQNTSSKLPTDVKVSATDSVAGKVVKAEESFSRPLIYVPSARHLHGFIITSASRQKVSKQVFDFEHIATSAFSWDVYPDDGSIKSIICIQIQIMSGVKSPACAVLCLSADRQNALDELDYASAKATAGVLARVM
jgi:hypothetical protein